MRLYQKMSDSDSDDSYLEYYSGDERYEEDLQYADHMIFKYWPHLNKISADLDFRPNSPKVHAPIHVYWGRVYHGIYNLQLSTGAKWTDTVFINAGHVMSHYSYPVIDKRFESERVNWENLHFCGGWTWKYNGDRRAENDKSDQEATLDRIISGKKIAGTIYGKMEQLESFKTRAEEYGFLTHLKFRSKMEWCPYKLMIADPIPFEDAFDLDALEADYREYFRAMDKENPPDFSILRGKSMSDFMDVDIDWGSSVGMHVIGLILGYAIESTICRAFKG